MKAVILAAGEGNRMHPLTYTRPKVMLPIANRPILEHLLIELKKAGVNEFTLVVGYHAETIRQHFGDGSKWGVSIDYVTQRKQLGTAHAVKTVEGLVGDKFLLANGDVLLKAEDVAKLLAKDTIALCLTEVKDTRDLGVVEIAGDKNQGDT
jgi:NDP-sugar pyrophosphorylase family protein